MTRYRISVGVFAIVSTLASINAQVDECESQHSCPATPEPEELDSEMPVLMIQTGSMIVPPQPHAAEPVVLPLDILETTVTSDATLPATRVLSQVDRHTVSTSIVDTQCLELQRVLDTTTTAPPAVVAIAQTLARLGGLQSCRVVMVGFQCWRPIAMVFLLGAVSLISAGFFVVAVTYQKFGLSKLSAPDSYSECMCPDFLHVCDQRKHGDVRKEDKASEKVFDVLADAAKEYDMKASTDSAEILRAAAEAMERRLNWSELNEEAKNIAVQQLKGINGHLLKPYHSAEAAADAILGVQAQALCPNDDAQRERSEKNFISFST